MTTALYWSHSSFSAAAGISASLVTPASALASSKRVLEPRAVDVEHDAAVHRDEAAVRVVGEALVVGARGQALDALVVEPEVEDGVHHPGHRELGARAHADEQRIGGIAEAAAHRLLQLGDVGGDLVVEAGRPAAVHVGAAGVGGDGEARRHRQLEHARHLGEVGALAAEEVLVLHRRATVLVVEGVDVGLGGLDGRHGVGVVTTPLRSGV